MSVSKSLSWLLIGASVACSVLLSEEPLQCKKDSDCAELGFADSTCSTSGVCVAPADGSGGTGEAGAGSGGTGVTPEGGQGGVAAQGNAGGAGGVGGVAGASGGESGNAGAGGSGPPPEPPSGIRMSGASLTNVAGGSQHPYVDTCPDDQVLVGVNGWTQTDATPPGLMGGQAVCGTLVLNEDTGSYSITVDPGATLDVRGTSSAVDTVEDPALCPANQVAVGFDGRAGGWMAKITLYCAPLTVSENPDAYALKIGTAVAGESTGDESGSAFSKLSCPSGQVARGTHIQTGGYLDAFGLVCSKPHLVYPEGTACSQNSDCDSANCNVDVCDASTCVAPGGCDCAQYSAREYLLCTNATDVPTASTFCSDRGMHLVRVDDGAENGWLRSTANLRALGKFWLGASDTATPDTWVWSDGDQFWQGGFGGAAVGGLYNLWAGNQPDNAGGSGESCAEVWPSSDWNDSQCTDTDDFICEPP